jgi:hypothetical protein
VSCEAWLSHNSRRGRRGRACGSKWFLSQSSPGHAGVPRLLITEITISRNSRCFGPNPNESLCSTLLTMYLILRLFCERRLLGVRLSRRFRLSVDPVVQGVPVEAVTNARRHVLISRPDVLSNLLLR